MSAPMSFILAMKPEQEAEDMSMIGPRLADSERQRIYCLCLTRLRYRAITGISWVLLQLTVDTVGFDTSRQGRSIEKVPYSSG